MTLSKSINFYFCTSLEGMGVWQLAAEGGMFSKGCHTRRSYNLGGIDVHIAIHIKRKMRLVFSLTQIFGFPAD